MNSDADTPGLLLIEGDADTLKRQRHSALGDKIEQLSKSFTPQGQTRFLRVRLRTQNDIQLGRALATATRYPAIVLVAHGGPDGVVAGRGLRMSWPDVAEALAPLQPRLLLAVSCFGGLAGPTETMFKRIPTLTTIIGYAAPISIRQAQVATIEALMAAHGLDLPTEASFLLYTANAIASNGVLFRRTRAGLEQSSPGERALVDFAGIFAWLAMSGDDNGRGLPIRA